MVVSTYYSFVPVSIIQTPNSKLQGDLGIILLHTLMIANTTLSDSRCQHTLLPYTCHTPTQQTKIFQIWPQHLSSAEVMYQQCSLEYWSSTWIWMIIVMQLNIFSICLIGLLLFLWIFVDDGLLVGISADAAVFTKRSEKKNSKKSIQTIETERATDSHPDAVWLIHMPTGHIFMEVNGICVDSILCIKYQFALLFKPKISYQWSNAYFCSHSYPQILVYPLISSRRLTVSSTFGESSRSILFGPHNSLSPPNRPWLIIISHAKLLGDRYMTMAMM